MSEPEAAPEDPRLDAPTLVPDTSVAAKSHVVPEELRKEALDAPLRGARSSATPRRTVLAVRMHGGRLSGRIDPRLPLTFVVAFRSAIGSR